MKVRVMRNVSSRKSSLLKSMFQVYTAEGLGKDFILKTVQEVLFSSSLDAHCWNSLCRCMLSCCTVSARTVKQLWSPRFSNSCYSCYFLRCASVSVELRTSVSSTTSTTVLLHLSAIDSKFFPFCWTTNLEEYSGGDDGDDDGGGASTPSRLQLRKVVEWPLRATWLQVTVIINDTCKQKWVRETGWLETLVRLSMSRSIVQPTMTAALAQAPSHRSSTFSSFFLPFLVLFHSPQSIDRYGETLKLASSLGVLCLCACLFVRLYTICRLVLHDEKRKKE